MAIQNPKSRVHSGQRSRPPASAGRAGAPSLQLDRIIHERMRLAIVSTLAANDTLSFAELKGLLGTTDGNLSVHARKLEDAGYLACKKSFEGRVPKTEYHLTPEGRRAFQKYVDHLETLVRRARKT